MGVILLTEIVSKEHFPSFWYMHDDEQLIVVTFFTSLFDSKPTLTDTSSSELFYFERKVAAGKYNRYARNIITDIGEFITDTMKMKAE